LVVEKLNAILEKENIEVPSAEDIYRIEEIKDDIPFRMNLKKLAT
jgi:hypothetical protein